MKYLNNPTNIRISRSRWLGELEHGNFKFCRFSEMKYGVRAAIYLLTISYPKRGCVTIADAIYRWAPPRENQTQLYISFCSRYVDTDKKLKDLDDISLYLLLCAMCRIESNYSLPRSIFENALKLL